MLTLYEKGYSSKSTLQIIQKYELAYKDNGIDMFFFKLEHQEYKKELDEPLIGLTQKVRSFSDMKEELISLLKIV